MVQPLLHITAALGAACADAIVGAGAATPCPRRPSQEVGRIKVTAHAEFLQIEENHVRQIHAAKAQRAGSPSIGDGAERGARAMARSAERRSERSDDGAGQDGAERGARARPGAKRRDRGAELR